MAAEHSQLFYRAKGRVAQYRELVQQAGKDVANRRAASRQQHERRALRRGAALRALELQAEAERLADSLRCELCDVVRAEAYGSGHADWATRQCSACWTRSAAASAQARHAPLLDLSDPTPARTDTRSGLARSQPSGDPLLAKVRAAEEKLTVLMLGGSEQLMGMAVAASASPLGRSARLHQSPSPQATRPGVPVPHTFQHAGGSGGAAQAGSAALQPGAQQQGQQQQQREGHRQGRLQGPVNEQAVESDGGVAASPSGGEVLPGVTSTAVAAGEEEVSEAQAAAAAVLEALRKGDRQAAARQLLAAPAETGALLAAALSSDGKNADAPASATTVSAADASRGQRGAEQAGVGAEPTPGPPRLTAFDQVRADLAQAEYQLVFAPTQAERSTALALAFELRRSLGELRRLERREAYMHRMLRNQDRRSETYYAEQARVSGRLGADARPPRSVARPAAGAQGAEVSEEGVRDGLEGGRAPAAPGKVAGGEGQRDAELEAAAPKEGQGRGRLRGTHIPTAGGAGVGRDAQEGPGSGRQRESSGQQGQVNLLAADVEPKAGEGGTGVIGERGAGARGGSGAGGRDSEQRQGKGGERRPVSAPAHGARGGGRPGAGLGVTPGEVVAAESRMMRTSRALSEMQPQLAAATAVAATATAAPGAGHAVRPATSGPGRPRFHDGLAFVEETGVAVSSAVATAASVATVAEAGAPAVGQAEGRGKYVRFGVSGTPAGVAAADEAMERAYRTQRQQRESLARSAAETTGGEQAGSAAVDGAAARAAGRRVHSAGGGAAAGGLPGGSGGEGQGRGGAGVRESVDPARGAALVASAKLAGRPVPPPAKRTPLSRPPWARLRQALYGPPNYHSASRHQGELHKPSCHCTARYMEPMHPDKADPYRQVEPLGWRPTGRAPALLHPTGWQAAGAHCRGVGFQG